MASSPNIPKTLLFHALILILSPPFLYQGHKLAAADYTLIKAECHNSETPGTCMNCVTSHPGAEKADRVGIATIVVSCISSQVQTLAHNMTSLASRVKDREMKNLYTNCSSGYSNAKTKLDPSAKQALKNHKYDIAEKSVVQAQALTFACQDDLLDQPGGRVPADVTYNMKIYGELTEAACRIIERL